jgi:hypothetical protein
MSKRREKAGMLLFFNENKKRGGKGEVEKQSKK